MHSSHNLVGTYSCTLTTHDCDAQTLFLQNESGPMCVPTQGQWMEIHPPLTPSGWLSWPGSSRAEHRTWPLLQEERGWLGSDNTCLLQTTLRLT